MFSKLIGGISIALLGISVGWSSECRELKAVKVDAPPLTDGKLNDACWKKAPEIKNFAVRNLNKPPERKTSAKIVYTDTAIYFGIKAMIPEDKIVARKSPRDTWASSGECVEVMLDPLGNADTYYHFVVNPVNSILDRACEQGDYVGHNSWNSDMKSATSRNKNFWICEIMIPYYSLELLSPPSKHWAINICRESHNPGLELSSIAKDGLFNVGGSFRRLSKLNVDFSRYCWNIEIPKHKSRIKNGKLSLTLDGIISNATGADRKVKIDCSLFSPDEKMHSKERKENFASSEKKNIDYGTFMLEEQGDYLCQFKLDDADNGRTLCKKKLQLSVYYIPMAIDLQEPWYRDAIFATQKLEKVKFAVKINLPAEKINNMTLESGIRVVASTAALQDKKIAAPKLENSFSFNAKSLPDGKLEIFAELKDKNGKTTAATTHTLLKLPYKKGEVWRGKDLNWYADGKKIFILSTWCPEELCFPEFNIIMHWKTPNAMLLSSSTIFGARKMRSIIKNKGVTKEVLDFYRKRVQKDKDNPKLFGYYFWDEPGCQRMKAKSLNMIYRVICEEDPYHPVIISTGGGGAVKYPDCAEINGFHCYPKVEATETMPNFRKIVVCMDRIRNFFKDRKLKQTVTYMHQGFNYGDCEDTGARVPTYKEFRNQDIMTLILGGKGFLQYNTVAFRLYPELSIGLPHLTKEQAVIGNEAIIAPDAAKPAHCGKPQMRLLTKDNNGDIWILACNASEEPEKFTISIPGLDGKTLRVLSEMRNVKVSNGSFTDKFGKYETHVYTTNSKDFGLTPLSKIVSEIDAANKTRHKPGNIAFQNYEGEHIRMSCSSSKAARRRADNGLWRLTDGIFPKGDPSRNSPPYVSIWEDKTDNQFPDWVEMKLSKPTKIGRVVVYPLDKSLRDYKIEAWVNGNWIALDEVKGKNDNVIEHKFAPVKTDRIRLFVTAANGANTKVQEIELYEK